jgi:hypothetical protein
MPAVEAQALRLGEELELWINKGLDRALAKQIRAEGVNGAETCFLQMSQSRLEVLAGRRVCLSAARRESSRPGSDSIAW